MCPDNLHYCENNYVVVLFLIRMLEKRSMSYVDGPIPVPLDDSFLLDNVQRICICDTGSYDSHPNALLFFMHLTLLYICCA